jgi:hypothetical protein
MLGLTTSILPNQLSSIFLSFGKRRQAWPRSSKCHRLTSYSFVHCSFVWNSFRKRSAAVTIFPCRHNPSWSNSKTEFCSMRIEQEIVQYTPLLNSVMHRDSFVPTNGTRFKSSELNSFELAVIPVPTSPLSQELIRHIPQDSSSCVNVNEYTWDAAKRGILVATAATQLPPVGLQKLRYASANLP